MNLTTSLFLFSLGLLLSTVNALQTAHADTTLENCSCKGQPWTEGGENCASSSVTSCLFTAVVSIRMKRIRHGWVLLLTLLASARECVPGCICSMKEGCLKWDRSWQSGQLENPLQDAQTQRSTFRNNGQGNNHMHILWISD